MRRAMQLAVADVVPASKFMREDAKERVAALRLQRLRQAHQFGELIIGKADGAAKRSA
jgi:hypothetical protein